MIPLAFLIGVVVGALALRFLVPRIRRQQFEEELRGDWWTRFERDFYRYASAWRGTRDADQPS